MSESKEPKVTECWAKEKWDKDQGFYGYPSLFGISVGQFSPNYRPAILMWKEDYDALVKELEELRKRTRYNLEPGAQITNWDEYERVRKELEELRAENERLLDAYASEKLLNGAVAGAPLNLFSK